MERVVGKIAHHTRYPRRAVRPLVEKHYQAALEVAQQRKQEAGDSVSLLKLVADEVMTRAGLERRD